VSDRIKGCWVSFERDMRAEDAETILDAIRALRGVAAVEVFVADHADWMARQRVRREIGEKLRALYEAI
jgi:hypothetical protein